jgi:hypothetical protein
VKLWTTSIETEPDVVFADLGQRSWKRTLDITWFSIDWVTWFKTERSPSWRPVDERTIEVRRPFEFNAFHAWYDGPHCAWSLGFLHIYWPKANCKKCWPDNS